MTVGLSPEFPAKYLGPNVYLVTVVTRNREPTGADYRQPETGKLYPINTFWQVSKNPTTGVEGEIWVLTKIVANVAYWQILGSGSAGPLVNVDVDASTPPGTDPVIPTAMGTIRITGGQVAAAAIGTNVIRTNSLAVNTFTIEIQRSSAAAATDITLNGVAHFNSAQFTVDANGFVSLSGGGSAIDQIAVDTFTAPGTNPVVPSGTGQITVTGGQVAAGTVGANAIRTDSLAANTYTIEIQRAASAASSSVNNAGIISADSSQFTIDSNGWLQLKTGVNPYGVGNISIGYSGGTFTVAGYDGTALSATNPGVVWLQDKTTPGHLRRYLVTANQSFTDGSAGQIDNMRWGVTTGVNWALDAPFYLYAVTNDALDTIAFAISRVPHLTSSPAAAKIGKQGAVVNVSQSDMYLLPNVTVADYEQNPCICLGAFRMQFAGATDSWTVQTLNATDGIGQFHEETWFVAPLGQMGATTSTYFITQAGTQPVFDSGQSSVSYKVSKTGRMDHSMLLINCTTPGTGGAALTLALPYNTTFTGSQGPFGQFNGSLNTTGPSALLLAGALSGANHLVMAADGAAANLAQSAVLAGNALQGYLNSVLISP